MLKVFNRVPHVILAISYAKMSAIHSSGRVHWSCSADTPLQTDCSNQRL